VQDAINPTTEEVPLLNSNLTGLTINRAVQRQGYAK